MCDAEADVDVIFHYAHHLVIAYIISYKAY